jgi:hypothetical protein
LKDSLSIEHLSSRLLIRKCSLLLRLLLFIILPLIRQRKIREKLWKKLPLPRENLLLHKRRTYPLLPSKRHSKLLQNMKKRLKSNTSPLLSLPKRKLLLLLQVTTEWPLNQTKFQQSKSQPTLLLLLPRKVLLRRGKRYTTSLRSFLLLHLLQRLSRLTSSLCVSRCLFRRVVLREDLPLLLPLADDCIPSN